MWTSPVPEAAFVAVRRCRRRRLDRLLCSLSQVDYLGEDTSEEVELEPEMARPVLRSRHKRALAT